MAVEGGPGRVGGVAWAAVISIIVGLAQFLVYAVWIGGISKQVDVNTNWIASRNAAILDQRVAVLETEQKNLAALVMAIDHRLGLVDERLEHHQLEDRQNFQGLKEPVR